MGAGLGVLRTVGAPTPSADRGGSRVTLCLGVLAVLWDCGGLQPLEEPQWASVRAGEGAGAHGLPGHHASRGGGHGHLRSVTGGLLQRASP